MKLEQRLSDTCKLTSTLHSIDAVEQSIILQISDTTPDEEKAATTARITDILVKNDWIIVNVQTIEHAVTIEYTKLAGPIELVETMMNC